MVASDLNRLVSPSSIAVIGATERVDASGERVMRNLVNSGFQGNVYPVNRGRQSIYGLPTWPSIRDVPSAPDLVIFAVPMDSVVEQLELCGELGVRGALVLAASRVASHSRSLSDLCERYEIGLLGPNCNGFLNVPKHVYATMSSCGSLPIIVPGPVAIVSQSGGVLTNVLNRAVDRGIGVSLAIAVGDEVDISIADALDHLVGDDATETVLLYVESFRRVEAFCKSARALYHGGKRLVAIRGGASPAGQTAATTHTGSLATEAAIVDSVLEEVGAIVVDGLEAGLNALTLMARVGWPKGTVRLGIVGVSGGGGVLAADGAFRAQLGLAQFSDRTHGALEMVLPALAAVDNPLDITAGAMESPTTVQRAIEIVSEDENVNATVCLGVLGGRPIADGMLRASRDIAGRGRPIVVASEVGSLLEDSFAASRLDSVVIDGIENAMQAIKAVTRARPPLEPGSTVGSDVDIDVSAYRTVGTPSLSEDDSLRLLAALGIPTALPQSVASTDLRYPLVLKVASPSIHHKQRSGLLITDIRNPAELEHARARLEEVAENLGLSDWHFFTQEMVAGGLELFAGLKRDPVFGPVVVVGLGGTLVERLRIARVARAPIAISNAERMVRELEVPSEAMTSEAIGRVIDIVQKLGHLGVADDLMIETCDVNPIIVSRHGDVRIVDAKIEWASEAVAYAKLEAAP